MKKTMIYLTLFLYFSFFSIKAQEMSNYTGTVENIKGVPVFMFSKPTAAYTETGKAASFGDIVKMGVNETKTVDEKAQVMIENAFKRKENGKVGAFDAIIVDMLKEKILGIKFNSGKSNEAKIQAVEGIPVYFYAKPDAAYEVVMDIPAKFSRKAERGMLIDRVLYVVKQSKKKLENGEIKAFDAIIFNPKDLTSKAIKFKN